MIICFGSDHFSPIFRHISFAVSGWARNISCKSQAVRSLQVKKIKIKIHSLGLYVGCPRPLNRSVRLIEVVRVYSILLSLLSGL